jgi:predicted ATPase/class 3 adenylate cyclase
MTRPMSRSDLPTGTVTFVFTDIEGSTRLVARLGDRYEALADEHRHIVRAAIEAHGGTEVNTEGDGFFVVFPSASGAVAAVAQAQQNLARHPWPADGVIRVRMGVHTGEGRLGGADYAGMDVHRASRVAAAGHGGQVVLSDATRAIVAPALPGGLALRDLGEHRLKDLPSPERLWQLQVEGLPVDFPALRSLDARPNNLPLAGSPLVGRLREMDELADLLTRRRLVTLTGPGGTGKTRLALELARRLLPGFPDGVFFVALEEARDRAAVVARIAAELGIHDQPERELEAVLAGSLRDRRLLLVLDNFEQAVQAAPLVADLVARSPGLVVVVTSREILRVSGEQEYAVPPLGVPDAVDLPPPERLAEYESVALFVERASAVVAGFALTADNADAVAGICRRLDGLPLAIELAASRVKLLSPQAILQRLERSLPLLTGGGRDVSDRQRTLRGAIDWSYELLDEVERRLFTRLAVFAGGWTLDAAEAVASPAGELGTEVLDGMALLADKSLVRVEPGGDRFSMLHVVREYAAGVLDADPAADEVRRRHASHVLKVAEEAEPELVGSDIPSWQRRLRAEEENIRTALAWATERGETELGLRIAGALWQYWLYWGAMREGRRWLEGVLRLESRPGPDGARAKARSAFAGLVYWQGEMALAEELYSAALATYRDLGDEARVAGTLHDLAWTAAGRGDGAAAGIRASESARAYERAGDAGGRIRVDTWLRVGKFLLGMGGDLEEAVDSTRAWIAAEREAGRMHDLGEALGTLSLLHLRSGNVPASAAAAQDALRTWHEVGNVGRVAQYLKMIAALELRLDHPESAVRLAAAAARMSDDLGGSLPDSLTQLGDTLELGRERLAPDEHARAMAEGRAMSRDAAIGAAFGALQVAPAADRLADEH